MQLNFKKSGHGPNLIILHGLFGSADNWMSIAKNLENEYTLYLIDQRNHGESDHSEQWDYEVMVEDLKEWMDEQGLDKAHLMGHSMGGKTAMNFALRYPEKVDRLVIADMAPREYPIHHQTILEGLNAVNLSNIRSRNDADEAMKPYIPEWGIRQFLLKSLTRKNGSFAWKINLPVITEKIENVGEGVTGDKSFSGPTLFMGGANSNYIQDKDKEDIAKFFPESHVIHIKNAGHWLHAEQPEAVVDTLKAFLRAK